MSSLHATNKENLPIPDKSIMATLWKTLLLIGVIFYFLSIISSKNNHSYSPSDDSIVLAKKSKIFRSKISLPPFTNISHILFGIIGFQGSWNYRKGYVESWWRPNITRGYLYLDVPPSIERDLPWSSNSPPFRVSENLGALVAETNPIAPPVLRMVHAILEIFRENPKGFRWLVMGDDDTIFFVDNLVRLLEKYDHNEYYYIGNPSEDMLSNFWFSFNMAFGGGGAILSYPLVKALADNMDSCLRRYPFLKTADIMTMACISDIGVNLSPHKGIHQVNFSILYMFMYVP